MKNIKYLVTALILSVNSTVAMADSARDELDRISRSEKTWQQKMVRMADYDGDVQVYVTDDGTLRLAKLPVEFIATASLDRPDMSHFDDRTFRALCDASRMAFRTIKKNRAPYVLTVRGYPFARQGDVVFQNAPFLQRMNPKLVLSPQANAVVDTAINVADFENVIRVQLEKQKQDLLDTGVATLDLTGWDDVACDLIQGQGQLKIALTIGYEAPTVARQTIISDRELQDLYDGVSKNWQSQPTLIRNYVLAGAALGGTLWMNLKKSPLDFGLDNLIGLFTQLFGVTDGQLKDLSGANFTNLAANLDILTRGDNVETPVLRTRVLVKK